MDRTILWRWAVVLLISTVAGATLFSLPIKDDALDLLPGDAVKQELVHLQQMGLVDRLFITLSAEQNGCNEAAVRRGAAKFTEALQHSGLFSFVLGHLPPGYERELFTVAGNSLPLLLEPGDYSHLESRLEESALRTRLQELFKLMNSPAGIAMKQQVQRDPLGFSGLFFEKMRHLRSEFSMRIEDGFFVSEDGRHLLLLAQSRLPLTDSTAAERIEKVVNEAAARTLPPGCSLRIIGSLPHTLANSRIIQHDLAVLLPVASILLIGLLVVTLRDPRAPLVFAVPFLAAPPAIAMTGLVYHEVSRLALGFGIVLLGIAVDFGVHLFVALREETGTRQAVLARLSRPILFATLTTSTVFVILFHSQVASHRQMALLAITGILLAVAFAWLLIPTLVREKTDWGLRGNPGVKVRSRNTSLLPLLCWLLLVVAGLVCWPQLKFNGDLRVLDVPDTKVQDDEDYFARIWGEKGEQAFVIISGATLGPVLEANSQVYRELQRYGSNRFQSFAPILPGLETQQRNLQAWNTFWENRREDFIASFSRVAESTGFSASAFRPFFASLVEQPQPLEARALLEGKLRPLFLSLLQEYQPGSDGSRYLALTMVEYDRQMAPFYNELKKKIEGLAVVANPLWRAAVEKQLRHDILTLSLAAGAAIAFLVTVLFRRTAAVIAVLAPVVAALSAMAVYSYISGEGLNMMHLLMAIMVIGLSVDYGIFIVCNILNEGGSSSLRAVSICAASSIIGFGVLAFAAHPALHALGTTVLAGIGAAWPTAVYVSPALLGRLEG